MKILGVDTGQTGALSVVNMEVGHAPKLEAVLRMPIQLLGAKKIVHALEVIKWLEEHPVDIAIVELVHAMPKQGVSSTFQFGRSAGAIEALVWSHVGRIDWITPQVWKKEHKLIGLPKSAACDATERVFGWRPKLKKDEAQAEAALIALAWGRINGTMTPTPKEEA